MSIVRVGLAETRNFAEGYDAIFGKKRAKGDKTASAPKGATKKAAAKKGGGKKAPAKAAAAKKSGAPRGGAQKSARAARKK